MEAVPSEREVVELTKNWMSKLGINLADVERKNGSTEPNFHVFDSKTTYFVNRAAITNVEFRGVRFRRSVDGGSFIGAGAGGNCEFRFGDHGKVMKISISWRTLKRQKQVVTASPETLIKWMREGRAVQGMMVMGADPINWKTVKSVVVTKVELCYYGGGPFDPNEWLMPFVALWTMVDTGESKIDLEIDCPIFDEK